MEYSKINDVKDIDVGRKVFVITPAHPNVVSVIDLSRVPKDKALRKGITKQVKGWIKKGYAYQEST